MRRREFIAGLLLAATMGRTRAQQTTKAYRIAFVDPATSVAEMNERTDLNPFIQAFFRELRQLGYVEGQNILIERYSGKGRAAAGQTAYYPGFVGEVVRRKPDLIFVMGNHLLLDFKAETTTIPIVGAAADPVAAGIVPSLSRPGGNITGVSPFFDLTIWSKYVEYLTEVAPKASRIGLLASHYGWETAMGAAVREATQRLKVSLIGPPLEAPYHQAEYRRVLALMVQEGAEAIIVGDLSETFGNRQLVVELARQYRLPAIYPFREFVEVGGLMAYGPNAVGPARHAAHQVDLILKGAKPGDLPFFQSTKLVLTINLNAAKALGIDMPSSLLARADEVIE